MKRFNKCMLALMLVMVMVLTIPVGAMASGYPSTYNVIFKAGNEVVAEFKDVSYVDSVVVPAYQDVETWYCAEEKQETSTGARVYADFGMKKDVVFQADGVYPESFTIVFKDDDENVVAQQYIDSFDFYWGIDIPAGNWMNYDLRLLVNDRDYISGQILDLDYTWFSTNPVVTFYAN